MNKLIAISLVLSLAACAPKKQPTHVGERTPDSTYAPNADQRLSEAMERLLGS